MTLTEQHRKAGARIAAWIAENGPKRMVEIVAHTGRNLNFCEKAMLAAKHAGQITRIRYGGRAVVWCTEQAADAIREEQRIGRAVYAAALYHRRRARGLITSQNMLIDPPDWEIEQRIIPAGTKPPPATRAPNSVFAWRPA